MSDAPRTPSSPTSSPTALLEREAETSSDASHASGDPHYPRPSLIRLARFLFRRSFFALLAYPIAGIVQMVQTAANQGLGVLGDGATWRHAFYLDQLGPYISDHPIILLPIALIVVILVLVGLLAHRDFEHEQAVLRERAAHTSLDEKLPAKLDSHLPTKLKEHLPSALADLGYTPKAAPTAAAAPPPAPRDFAGLPVPETGLIGRQEELAWLEDRLRRGGATGISAVSGLGGIGKTALAGVAVRDLFELEGRFQDGVAVVNGLNKGDGATDALALLREALLEFAPSGSTLPDPATMQQLATAAYEWLHGKDALLVFDNVEPELDVPTLLEPLRAANVCVLLTARGLLPLPPEARRELGLLLEDDALILFARAYGRSSIADLSDTERLGAERIVVALDRHTLAVQLAGAEAADLKRPLDDEFVREVEAHPLRIQGRDAEGQRAVEERLMLSIRRLPDEARRLFAAFTVIATPAFGRLAASAIAKGLGLTQPEETVDRLVRRALLEKTIDEHLPKGSDRERLRLHPLLRSLGEALTDLADQALAANALAEHYAAYTNATEDSALTPDLENIGGSLEWAYTAASAEDRDRLVVSLCIGTQYAWRDRSRTAASLRYLPWGIDAAERISAANGEQEGRLDVARLDLSYAIALLTAGKTQRAEEVTQASLAICRAEQDRWGEGAALNVLAMVAQARGDLDAAQAYLEQALPILREVQDRQGEGATLTNLGMVAQARGQFDAAQAYYEQGLAIDHELEDQGGEATDLSNLGTVAWSRGDMDAAQAYLEQALPILREVQDRRAEGTTLNNLGMVAQARGQLDAAQAYYEQALPILREVQDRRMEGTTLNNLGMVAQARGDLDEAQAYLEQALPILREVQDRRMEGATLNNLGLVAWSRGDLDEAQAYYEQTLPILREVQDRQGEGTTLNNLGLVAQARGDLDEAQAYYEQALPILREVQDRRAEGTTLNNLGLVAQARGDLDEAQAYLEQALPILREVQDRRTEGTTLNNLAFLARERGRPEDAARWDRERAGLLSAGPSAGDA